MKSLLIASAFALILAAATPLRAEDWKTINGKVYTEVKVIKVEADAVTVLYRDGGALIPLILLPEDLQKRFHYDPAKAKAAADARDQADLNNARALRTERHDFTERRQLAPVTAPSISPPTSVAADSATHHSMDSIANPSESLWDNGASPTHYSTNEGVPRGRLSQSPYDSKHYSMDSVDGAHN